MIQLDTAKKRLATVWFLGGGLLFLVFILQTLFGRYIDEEKEAWGWFLPNVMPTLLLIVGALRLEGKGEAVDNFTYLIAFYLSIFYLVIVSLTIFLNPISQQYSERSPLQLLQLSNLFIGPLQGMVSGSIGWFFIKSKS